MIEKAKFEDLPEILSLQKLAYLSEAKLVNDFSIQPLAQTLEELQQEFEQGIILKYMENGKTLGSVRANVVNEIVKIGKLMVHPQWQKKGIGNKLLMEIETYYENNVFELFTSSLSEKNISLYKKNDYNEVKRKKITPNLEMIFLRKGK